jgi:hypothetical protein
MLSAVSAHVIDGSPRSETRDFAEGHTQLAETFATIDRAAELLPASLALGGSHGITKEGKHGDDEQWR